MVFFIAPSSTGISDKDDPPSHNNHIQGCHGGQFKVLLAIKSSIQYENPIFHILHEIVGTPFPDDANKQKRLS